MPLVLVVEDEEPIRNNLVRLLRIEGYDAVGASDGTSGITMARTIRPDLIISDVSMPGMDGFNMLSQVRGDTVIGTTPVLLLTALDDRTNFRRGMTMGADDYLPKPFTRDEILSAVRALIAKHTRVEQHAVAKAEQELQQKEQLHRTLPGAQVSAAAGHPLYEQPQVIEGSVLDCSIRRFTTIAARLSAPEVAQFLRAFLERASVSLKESGATQIRFAGGGLVAVFSDHPRHAWRAARGATELRNMIQSFGQWVTQQFPGRGIPPFAIAIGVASGQMTMTRFTGVSQTEEAPIGAPVEIASRVSAVAKEFGWTIALDADTRTAAGSGLVVGSAANLKVQGQANPIKVYELVDLNREQRLTDSFIGPVDSKQDEEELARILKDNSEKTAHEIKRELEDSLQRLSLSSTIPGASADAPIIKGYQIQRRIGSGAMSEVFLARAVDRQGKPGGSEVVLKIIDTSSRQPDEAQDILERFLQEYALLSEVDHPNVVRIYDQGITDRHAFIAMEYFPGGDLRSVLKAAGTPKQSLGREQSLRIVRQAAQALLCIHSRGIVHRDMKPENLMLRADGTLVLADFGVAKSNDDALASTRHGEVIGTPFYISPEQASGRMAMPASDLYSLGIILYECLTGDKPFLADSLPSLLSQHINAPTPHLPSQFSDIQPLFERLMIKEPHIRCADAGYVCREIDALLQKEQVHDPLTSSVFLDDIDPNMPM